MPGVEESTRRHSLERQLLEVRAIARVEAWSTHAGDAKTCTQIAIKNTNKSSGMNIKHAPKVRGNTMRDLTAILATVGLP